MTLVDGRYYIQTSTYIPSLTINTTTAELILDSKSSPHPERPGEIKPGDFFIVHITADRLSSYHRGITRF